MTERYDPDVEMVARAMAEMHEAVEAARPVRVGFEGYRSTSAAAEARRALLRELAAAARRRFLGEPA